jgi:hypothetical protein
VYFGVRLRLRFSAQTEPINRNNRSIYNPARAWPKQVTSPPKPIAPPFLLRPQPPRPQPATLIPKPLKTRHSTTPNAAAAARTCQHCVRRRRLHPPPTMPPRLHRPRIHASTPPLLGSSTLHISTSRRPPQAAARRNRRPQAELQHCAGGQERRVGTGGRG